MLLARRGATRSLATVHATVLWRLRHSRRVSARRLHLGSDFQKKMRTGTILRTVLTLQIDPACFQGKVVGLRKNILFEFFLTQTQLTQNTVKQKKSEKQLESREVSYCQSERSRTVKRSCTPHAILFLYGRHDGVCS